MKLFRRELMCLLLLLGSTVFCSAQQASSWLERSWPGRAYLLGDPEAYDLVLKITKIKGKSYEGILSAVLTSDTSHSFTTPISGTIYDRYLRIKIENWPVKCGTCRPQILQFSMESKKFFMKGEAKGCSTVECTWITEFSNKLIDFDKKQEDLLFALAREERYEPEPPMPAASPEPVAKAEEPVVEKPVLPGGDIIESNKKASVTYGKKTVSGKAGFQVKENEPVESQLNLPAAGNIVFTEKTNQTPPKISAGLRGKPEYQVLKDVPAEVRTQLLPAGNIIIASKNSKASIIKGQLSGRPELHVMDNKPEEIRTKLLPVGEIVKQPATPSGIKKVHTSITGKPELVVIKDNPPEIKTDILPAGAITKTERQTADTVRKTDVPLAASSKQIKPLEKIELPEGYVERERKVIKTITVNTDSITLRVYDNGVVDGDIVSVIYNDRTVIDKLSLTSKAYVIKIPVNKTGLNTIVFHAHNLGEFPPNTALLEILYGNKKEELTVSSDLTVSSMIDIRYAP